MFLILANSWSGWFQLRAVQMRLKLFQLHFLSLFLGLLHQASFVSPRGILAWYLNLVANSFAKMRLRCGWNYFSRISTARLISFSRVRLKCSWNYFSRISTASTAFQSSQEISDGTILSSAASEIRRFCMVIRSLLPMSLETMRDPKKPVLLITVRIMRHAMLCHSVIMFLICVCWHPETRMCRALSTRERASLTCWEFEQYRIFLILKGACFVFHNDAFGL